MLIINNCALSLLFTNSLKFFLREWRENYYTATVLYKTHPGIRKKLRILRILRLKLPNQLPTNTVLSN